MPPVDKFENRSAGLDSPASEVFEITPDDSGDFPNLTRGIWVGDVSGGSDVKVVTHKGDEVTFSGCYAGQIIPVRAQKVFDTGTTAAALLGML